MIKLINKITFIIIILFLTLVKVKANEIFIGHLVDFTGPTSSVGKPFGQGFIDSIKFINTINFTFSFLLDLA